ncbi:MAG TPA: hypothetical protein VHB25_08555 [Gemmatimonadaceae bacterium]|nr:hypothetical protein [Gemmatimonadaceae bacterium]
MDTYGVVAADVAAELPGLFPGGFTVSTVPTLAQVTSAIATADTIVTLHVQNAAGQAPSIQDRAAPVAKRFIVDWVKAQVIRIVYAAQDPAQVAAAAKPYADLAQEAKDAITAMGAQAEGLGEASPRIQVPYTTAPRDLVVGDRDLDPCTPFRERRF